MSHYETGAERTNAASVDSGAIGRLNEAEREALTCDCGTMEDDPTWPETFCPFHAGRMDLEVSGSAEALLDTVERIVREHTDRALAEVEQRIEAESEAWLTRPMREDRPNTVGKGLVLAATIVRAARQEQGR